MDNINKLRILKELSIEDMSNDHVYTYGVSELSADRTITLPLLTNNDTFVFESHSQTLINKIIDFDNNTVSNIDNNNIKVGAVIDVTKLADGSVSNTEFQHLNNISSNIQVQLDSKALSSHNHSGTDINSGTISVSYGGTGVNSFTQDSWLMGNNISGIISIKNNMNASVSPTNLDDTSIGYEIGSRWFDTTSDHEYICLDSTDNNAVWKSTTIGE